MENQTTQEKSQVPTPTPETTPNKPFPFVEKKEPAVVLPGIVTVSARDYATLCEERAEARIRLEIQRAKTERIRAELQKAQDELSRVKQELTFWRNEAGIWRGRYYAAMADAATK